DDDDGDGTPTADELGNLNDPTDSDNDGVPDYLDPETKAEPSREDALPAATELSGGGFGCSVTGSGSSSSGPWGFVLVGLGIALWTRRRRRSGIALAAAAVAGVGLDSGSANAQELASGFSLNRFNP